MPKKTYKYNCACDSKIHTNNPHVFRVHVARCPICQEKLPKEILDSLQPGLNEMIEDIKKNTSLPKSDKTKKKEPVQKVATHKTDSPAIKEEIKDKETELDKVVRNLPSIQGLGKTVLSLKQDVGRLSSKIDNQLRGVDEELKSLGEVIGALVSAKAVKSSADIPPSEPIPSDNTPLPDTREDVKVPPEAGREQQEINEEVKKESTERTETLSSKSQAPPLRSKEEVLALEEYLQQQKQNLGMTEEIFKEPKEEGKSFIPGGDTIKQTVSEIREIIDAFRGRRNEGPSLPRTTEELASQVLIDTVKAAANKKDPVEYLVQGMKAQGESFTNAVKLITQITGKGSVSPSLDDIRKLIREEISSTGKKAEHVTETEE